MKKCVFNLEFPPWCPDLTVGEYKFTRVTDYPDRIRSLHQPATVHSEFSVPANTGTHAITAEVLCPTPEPAAVLDWSHDSPTALDDVLLLVTIFNHRNVFAIEPDKVADSGVVVADPRTHLWGTTIRLALPYKAEIVTKYMRYDIGLEEGLNQVLATIRSHAWQERFRGGHYLFLVRQLLQHRDLEPSFIQAWTIWEHLFAVLNRRWMAAKTIRNLAAREKIAFILVHEAMRHEIDIEGHRRIETLVEIRNRLVHHGRLPDRGDAHDDAVLFVRLTEYVIAGTLGLSPRHEYSALADLERFLKSERDR